MAALCVWLLFLSINGEPDDYAVPTLESTEQEAAYKVLEAINSEIEWRKLYPDNLCTGGPHGVVCGWDTGEEKWHIVEMSLGWVADSDNNPPCGTNAGFTPHLADLRHVRKLFFYRCFVNAKVKVPDYLGALQENLEELVFQDNPAMEGTLPAEIVTLSALRRFILSGSGVGGSIPAKLGNLKKLQQLVLSDNAFAGKIPCSVGELKELVILDLSRNELEGAVPSQISKLVSLAKLDLSFNRLNGTITPGLAQLKTLEFLDLSHNNFSGGVPSFLAELPNLADLHLSGNPLGGALPDVWGRPGLKLRSLGLSSAELVGMIPESIGDMKELNYIALDNNRLTGFIPARFGKMPHVYEMKLSNNDLAGFVPFSIDFVKKMGKGLHLEGNSGLYGYSCYSTLPLPQPTRPQTGGTSQIYTFVLPKLFLQMVFVALVFV
ncbi:piriformospora indica-insensitive protein 2 [Cryptomeria japonica]|uniref:piriformospora indica-insensitive protein 2 n=1 Tax=Cryptomeria japonica TaxID=3369 RepID=UPI0027DA8C66|nr:piriformospora indica-insensitive protein 2 [Cryptomeria japonica]